MFCASIFKHKLVEIRHLLRLQAPMKSDRNSKIFHHCLHSYKKNTRASPMIEHHFLAQSSLDR